MFLENQDQAVFLLVHRVKRSIYRQQRAAFVLIEKFSAEESGTQTAGSLSHGAAITKSSDLNQNSFAWRQITSN